VNLLSEMVPGWTGELTSELPAASEDAVESDEQQNDQKSAGETMPSVAAPVSVAPVRTEVWTMEAVGIPEWPEDKAEDQRDCDEDEDGWDDDKGEHRVFSIRSSVKRGPAHRICSDEPGKVRQNVCCRPRGVSSL
jgi:hypothetical protein